MSLTQVKGIIVVICPDSFKVKRPHYTRWWFQILVLAQGTFQSIVERFNRIPEDFFHAMDIFQIGTIWRRINSSHLWLVVSFWTMGMLISCRHWIFLDDRLWYKVIWEKWNINMPFCKWGWRKSNQSLHVRSIHIQLFCHWDHVIEMIFSFWQNCVVEWGHGAVWDKRLVFMFLAGVDANSRWQQLFEAGHAEEALFIAGDCAHPSVVAKLHFVRSSAFSNARRGKLPTIFLRGG